MLPHRVAPRSAALSIGTAVMVGLCASALHAQGEAAASADSASTRSSAASGTLPFRARQWGMLFSASNGFYGAGLLRFTRPDRAWLVDAAAFANVSQSGGGRDSWRGSFRGRVGQRRFAPIAPRVVRIMSLGLLSGYDYYTLEADEYVARERTGILGVFVDLGGQWLVTPNFALGGTVDAGLSGGYTYQRSTRPDGLGGIREDRETARTVNIGIGRAQAFVALYF